ncbi:hypothetical protein DTO217A2_4558 [Paecilomyces variotii]|nr:hypothetical protein DTO217A2_4558 [Paecilomyces variotii]
MAPWTDSNDRKLLLTLIDLKSKKDWARSAELMGPEFTAEACRQHFRKFKDEVDEIIAAAEGKKNTSTTADPTADTPKGRKRKAQATSSVSPKKRGRRAAAAKAVLERLDDRLVRFQHLADGSFAGFRTV